MIYMVEIEPLNLSTDSVDTQYLTNVGFTSSPSDTPANQHYEPRLENPGNFERALFSNGTTEGRSSVGFGEIVVLNTDRALDYFLDLAFDGRACRIYRMPDRNSFASRTLLIAGTVEQPTFEGTTIVLRFRDRLAELSDSAISDAVYAGTTTSSADSAEGRPEDLQGQSKPYGFGSVLSVPADPANVFDLIYKYSNRAASEVSAVRDAGVALTATSDYATLALLRAASLSAGEYATCLADGLLRLGGSPVGQVVVDFTDGNETASDVAAAILSAAGFGADIDTASFDALEAVNDAACGIWLRGSQSVLQAVSSVLQSIGGYLTVTSAGEFAVGRIEPAAGIPTVVLTRQDIVGELKRLPSGDQGRGIPAKKVTVNYARRYSGESVTSFAGSVSEADRTKLSREFLSVVEENSTVAAQRLLAPELVFDTYLANTSDAEDHAAWLIDVYSQRRDRLEVSVPATSGPYALGQIIGLDINQNREQLAGLQYYDLPERGLSLTNSYEQGDLAPENFLSYAAQPAVIAIDAVLPASPIDAILFDAGAYGSGTYFGVRDSGTIMRFRAGAGSSLSPATAVVDIPVSNLPFDGDLHTIVVAIHPTNGTLTVFVDGWLVGSGVTDGYSMNYTGAWAGGDTSGLGVVSSATVLNEPTTDWPSSIEEMRFYGNQTIAEASIKRAVGVVTGIVEDYSRNRTTLDIWL